MKLTVYLLFAIAATFLVVSCRKKIEREVVTVEDEESIHCTNGVMDEDENGLDCGGADCDTCVQQTVTCTQTDDNVRLNNGVVPIVQDYPVTSTEFSTSGSEYHFTANTSGTDYLKIKFGSKPDITQLYSGTSDGFSSLESNEVFIQYYQYSGPDIEGSGDVYVNLDDDGVYTIQACEYDFHPSGSSIVASDQQFKITFD